MMPMFDVQAFILVGGASRRMGQDKAGLMFGERTAVELIAHTLQSVTSSVITVGATVQKSEDVSSIPDLRESWGPLAGIEAALKHATSSHALVVGCDFPFVTGDLFKQLLSHATEADAVIPLQSDGRMQPLCSVFEVNTCLAATNAAIAAGGHSPRALLDRVQACYVPFSELSELAGAGHFFLNLNTPENYQRALEIFARQDQKA